MPTLNLVALSPICLSLGYLSCEHTANRLSKSELRVLEQMDGEEAGFIEGILIAFDTADPCSVNSLVAFSCH